MIKKNLFFLKSSWITGAGMLVVMCCAVYFPFIQNFFIWDDDTYLTKNPYLHDFDGLKPNLLPAQKNLERALLVVDKMDKFKK